MKFAKIRTTYRYRLTEKFSIQTKIKVDVDSKSQLDNFIAFNKEGVLTVFENFCWDGLSGPTLNFSHTQKASLVHDALYQLMEEGKLPQSARLAADKEFYHLLLSSGVAKMYCWYLYAGVRLFGKYYSKRKKPAIIITVE